MSKHKRFLDREVSISPERILHELRSAYADDGYDYRKPDYDRGRFSRESHQYDEREWKHDKWDKKQDFSKTAKRRNEHSVRERIKYPKEDDFHSKSLVHDRLERNYSYGKDKIPLHHERLSSLVDEENTSDKAVSLNLVVYYLVLIISSCPFFMHHLLFDDPGIHACQISMMCVNFFINQGLKRI